MNDFLTNLIGRAHQTLEVVQPRVPSIYEPYRRGSGLLGVRPGLHQPGPSSEPGLEAGSEGSVDATHINPQTDALRARNALPRREAQTEPAVEVGTEGGEIASSISQQTHKLGTGLASPTEGDESSAGYEPSQPGTGLLGPHLGIRRRDAEPAVESALEGDESSAGYEPSQPGAGLLRPHLGIRRRDAEPAGESALESDAEPAFSARQSHHMRQQVASLGARGGMPSEDEPHAPPVAGSKRPNSSGSVVPSLISHAIPHSIPAMEADASPNLPPTTFQPSLPTAKAREIQLIAASPGETRGDRSESSHPLAPSQFFAREGVAGHSRSPEMKTGTSSARLDVRDPAEPRRSAEPSVVAHPTSTVTGTVLPLFAPSLLARQAPVTGAVRPPLAPRSGDTNRPEARSSSGSTNPEVQVSIGKVEVRAVFPTPPAPRTQPPRRRPTVSLDDYLNRRHRGRR